MRDLKAERALTAEAEVERLKEKLHALSGSWVRERIALNIGGQSADSVDRRCGIRDTLTRCSRELRAALEAPHA
jgi:hypothetical protein